MAPRALDVESSLQKDGNGVYVHMYRCRCIKIDRYIDTYICVCMYCVCMFM